MITILDSSPATPQWITLVDTLKWPVLVLIIVFIFIKPLLKLINRITKIGYKGSTIETLQIQNADKQDIGVSNIDKVIGLFRTNTITFFENAVKKETELEKLTFEKDKIEKLTKYSIILYIMKDYEIIYNSIFGSQILLLQRLASFETESMTSLKRFYDEATSVYPNYFSDYSYENYMNFLFNYMLITSKGDRIFITDIGIDFLKYLTETGKSLTKYF